MTDLSQLKTLLERTTPGEVLAFQSSAQVNHKGGSQWSVGLVSDFGVECHGVRDDNYMLLSGICTQGDAELFAFLWNNAPAILSLVEQAGEVCEALHRAAPFVEALADCDPDEPIADNGMTVLGKLQYDAPALARQIRAALKGSSHD